MSKTRLYGQDEATTPGSEHNTQAFVVAQALRAVSTATICKVASCSASSTVGPIGTVDVLPLVDLVDGAMQTSHHVNVQKIPYLRIMGGSRCVILDPKPGDLGLVVFADRDTSSVRKNKKQSPPGSRRRFSMADGMYVGTILSADGNDPKTYVRFHDDGTLILANLQDSSQYPFEAVVGKNFVQIKQKGKPAMHFTIDGVSGTLIQGQVPAIGNDPYPQY